MQSPGSLEAAHEMWTLVVELVEGAVGADTGVLSQPGVARYPDHLGNRPECSPYSDRAGPRSAEQHRRLVGGRRRKQAAFRGTLVVSCMLNDARVE